MFENKKKINSELQKLKDYLGLNFSIDKLSKKELLVARKILVECKNNSLKKKTADFYEQNLTVILNENENSHIEAFGYCYELNEECGRNYSTKMICIKYKSEDEWKKIYEYKWGEDLDAYFLDRKTIRYDDLIACSPLSSKDKNTILEFIRYRDDALKIFNMYLETLEKRRKRR